MADTTEHTVTEFVVEIIDGSEPVRGRLALRGQPGAEFSGWSEFAATLERFRPASDQST